MFNIGGVVPCEAAGTLKSDHLDDVRILRRLAKGSKDVLSLVGEGIKYRSLKASQAHG